MSQVDRITRILKAVAHSKTGLTNAHLAKTQNIPKSTLSKLLASLVSCDYLTLDTTTKQYRLGPMLLYLGARYLENLDLIQIGQQFLQQLTLLTAEASALHIPTGLEVAMVARTRKPMENISRALLRLTEIGEHAPMYATAAGKAILAHRSGSEIDRYLDSVTLVPFTKNTITDTERFRHQINDIRSAGISYNYEELNEGTIAASAPVFDLYRRPVAALTVITPSFRFDDKKRECIEPALREASAAFSKQLGFGKNGQ